MNMTQPVEQDAELPLVEAVMRGDREALGEFTRRHERWVRGVIFGMTGRNDLADEVAQQVWITVWQQIATLRDPRAWRAWLYKLVRRATIDAGKRRHRIRRREVETNEDVVVEAPRTAMPDQELIEDEQRRQVMTAIRSLPPIYREPFVLRHLEGWTYAEIGQVMGLGVDTVETRLIRARRMLRESLQGLS
jgi:RNA polymerase sigma-70 factor, ECF subfamily